jgi:OOP family OmpA-OmpF porin
MSPFESDLRSRIRPPALPSFSLPGDLLSSPQDRDISGRLDLEPGLYEGIAVLGARCDTQGVARGVDAGSAVTTGSGSYRKGTVSVTVKADGTGVYNTPTRHVAVLANGSGVYEDGTRRLSVEPDGAGTFTDGVRRLTVRPDGSGSYSDAGSRLWIGPDGAGGYDDGTVRISVSPAGAVSGDGEPAQQEAVSRVVRDGFDRFPPVPALRRVKPVGRPCGTVIRLDANALFDFGSDALRPPARALIERVGTLLMVLRPGRLQLNGYTDQIGTRTANLALSRARAAAVRDELTRNGVPAGWMTVRGLGESDPVARETTAAGDDLPAARQLNRRVELILPKS